MSSSMEKHVDTAKYNRRITELLESLAMISVPGPGVSRLGYTPLEREAHSLFAASMEKLGLRVRVDSAGNTIAEHPGEVPGLPAIGTGSHLDSVPNGGRFDGIAGVVSAIVAAEQIIESGRPHQHPIRFVAFACEEGARFGQACVGSRLAAGLMSNGDVHARRDNDGVSIADAMAEVGLDAEEAARSPWDRTEWAAFIELHVEQGGQLERAEIPVGLVDLISGSTRLTLQVTGQASHTGATPMGERADALTAAAEIVLQAEALAMDSRHRGTRATIGRLEVAPGSITTIPGEVIMAVDIRDVDSDRQRMTAAELVRRARAICDRRNIELKVTLLGDASPVVLPSWVRDVLAAAAVEARVPYRSLTSGASHDAQMINHIMPTGMVFVPSKAGLSHVPSEWTDANDIFIGTQVLLEGLFGMDSVLTDRRALVKTEIGPTSA